MAPASERKLSFARCLCENSQTCVCSFLKCAPRFFVVFTFSLQWPFSNCILWRIVPKAEQHSHQTRFCTAPPRTKRLRCARCSVCSIFAQYKVYRNQHSLDCLFAFVEKRTHSPIRHTGEYRTLPLESISDTEIKQKTNSRPEAPQKFLN